MHAAKRRFVFAAITCAALAACDQDTTPPPPTSGLSEQPIIKDMEARINHLEEIAGVKHEPR